MSMGTWQVVGKFWNYNSANLVTAAGSSPAQWTEDQTSATIEEKYEKADHSTQSQS